MPAPLQRNNPLSRKPVTPPDSDSEATAALPDLRIKRENEYEEYDEQAAGQQHEQDSQPSPKRLRILAGPGPDDFILPHAPPSEHTLPARNHGVPDQPTAVISAASWYPPLLPASRILNPVRISPELVAYAVTTTPSVQQAPTASTASATPASYRFHNLAGPLNGRSLRLLPAAPEQRRTSQIARPAAAHTATSSAAATDAARAASRTAPIATPPAGDPGAQDALSLQARTAAVHMRNVSQLLQRAREHFVIPLERVHPRIPGETATIAAINNTAAIINAKLQTLAFLCQVLATDLATPQSARSTALPPLAGPDGVLAATATNVDRLATDLLILYQACTKVRETLASIVLPLAITVSSRLLSYANAIRYNNDRARIMRINAALQSE